MILHLLDRYPLKLWRSKFGRRATSGGRDLGIRQLHEATRLKAGRRQWKTLLSLQHASIDSFHPFPFAFRTLHQIVRAVNSWCCTADQSERSGLDDQCDLQSDSRFICLDVCFLLYQLDVFSRLQTAQKHTECRSL